MSGCFSLALQLYSTFIGILQKENSVLTEPFWFVFQCSFHAAAKQAVNTVKAIHNNKCKA